MDLEARQLRQEMKRRGHITVPKRGEDPEQVRRTRSHANVSCTRRSGRGVNTFDTSNQRRPTSSLFTAKNALFGHGTKPNAFWNSRSTQSQ